MSRPVMGAPDDTPEVWAMLDLIKSLAKERDKYKEVLEKIRDLTVADYSVVGNFLEISEEVYLMASTVLDSD